MAFELYSRFYERHKNTFYDLNFDNHKRKFNTVRVFEKCDLQSLKKRLYSQIYIKQLLHCFKSVSDTDFLQFYWLQSSNLAAECCNKEIGNNKTVWLSICRCYWPLLVIIEDPCVHHLEFCVEIVVHKILFHFSTQMIRMIKNFIVATWFYQTEEKTKLLCFV